MRIRFQADADLDGRILRGLRRVGPEVDVQTASCGRLGSPGRRRGFALGRRSRPDPNQKDRGTMPGHFQRFLSRSQSPGVILLRARVPLAVAIEELLLIWAASEAEEWINRFGLDSLMKSLLA